MSRLHKSLLSIILLVSLTVTTYVALLNRHVIVVSDRIQKYLDGIVISKPVGTALDIYYFWIATVLTLLIVILLLVVLFYPRTRTEFLLSGNGGRLTVKKSAIEGYIRTVMTSDGYMKHPDIRIKMFRKKINVNVTGEIIPRTDIIAKANEIKEEIQVGLEQFLGVNSQAYYDITVSNVSSDEGNRKKSRVE